jgi:acetaldehyde dehydrogenase/alcohol dehydrogenase
MIRILRHTAKFNNNAFTTEIGSIVMRARHAQQQWAGASDELVDRVFQRVALEASTHRIDLAQHALHETGRGVLEDKVIKNLFAVENVFNSFKTWRAPTTTTTTTTTTYNNDSTIMSFTPFGVIAALCPVTNPTSTAMYKALLAIRTRNAVVVCPHPSARQCTIRAVRVIANAATKAGAPQDLVSVLDDVSKSNVQQIMANSDLIWATGGADMVESAQKIGVPALLGGPGNCAALIDELCNVDDAVASVLLSKSFDHGMICAAEQTIVVVDAVYDRVRSALQTQGAVVLSQSDARKLGAAMHADGNYMNKAMVGKSPLVRICCCCCCCCFRSHFFFPR